MKKRFKNELEAIMYANWLLDSVAGQFDPKTRSIASKIIFAAQNNGKMPEGYEIENGEQK